MTNEKGIPSIPLVIAGKEYAMRFDVGAQIQAVQSLKLLSMGMPAKNWWALLDPPYDVSELLVMLLAGINGGKRFEGKTDFIDLEAAQKLLQEHFDSLYDISSEVEDDQKAFRSMDDAQIKLMNEISAIAKSGAGFRRKGMRQPKIPKEKK